MPSAGKLPSSWDPGHRIPLVADEAEGNSGWTPLTQSQPGHAPSAGHRLDGDAERAGGGGRLAIHNRGRSNRAPSPLSHHAGRAGSPLWYHEVRHD